MFTHVKGQVVRGFKALQRHGVDTNILCTVNSKNAAFPLEIYRYFRDDFGARYIQFIPIVERVALGESEAAEAGWRNQDGSFTLYRQDGDGLTSRTVDPHMYGAFLTEIFDEWVSMDVGTVFIQDFDVMVGAVFGHILYVRTCARMRHCPSYGA